MVRSVGTQLACTAFAVLAIAVPVLADGSTSGSVAHQRYLTELATLRNEGLPTTLAEVFPPLPPTGENAAPIYIDEIAKYPETPLEDDSDSVLRPLPTADDWKNAQAFVDKNSKLIGEIHKAASMPSCAIAGRSTAPDPAAILFPELDPMRRSARDLAIESIVMAHNGDPIDAIRNAALGFQIADHGYQNPTLIDYLDGVAIDALTLSAVEHITASNESNPEVIAAADQAVSTGWRVHPVANALRGELAMQIVEMNFVRHASLRELAQAYTSSFGSPSDIHSATQSPANWSDFIDANSVVIMKYFDTLISDSTAPCPTASEEVEALDADIKSKDGGDHTFSHTGLPVFTDAIDRQPQIASRAAIVRASAAVFAWKLSNGSYPGSLDQAMTDVPVDPFDGQPIRYRPDGEGFILYSVGPTGKYAGGAATGKDMVLRVSADGTAAWK